jgi:hypothetical protein
MAILKGGDHVRRTYYPGSCRDSNSPEIVSCFIYTHNS